MFKLIIIAIASIGAGYLASKKLINRDDRE
jgi:hypothetical protein